jgi:hypothetical protein
MACIENNSDCKNLIIKISSSGKFAGKLFYGCSKYPSCQNLIGINQNITDFSLEEQKVLKELHFFVEYNSFLSGDYWSIFNSLSNPGVLDYFLKTPVIKEEPSAPEVGLTGAKIFYDLFYHLFILPSNAIHEYLTLNFPKSTKAFELKQKPLVRFLFVDYNSDMIDVSGINSYRINY